MCKLSSSHRLTSSIAPRKSYFVWTESCWTVNVDSWHDSMNERFSYYIIELPPLCLVSVAMAVLDSGSTEMHIHNMNHWLYLNTVIIHFSSRASICTRRLYGTHGCRIDKMAILINCSVCASLESLSSHTVLTFNCAKLRPFDAVATHYDTTLR